MQTWIGVTLSHILVTGGSLESRSAAAGEGGTVVATDSVVLARRGSTPVYLDAACFRLSREAWRTGADRSFS